MTARPKKTRTPYTPSADLVTALADLKTEEAAFETARQAARRAVADELRASGQSNARVAEHTPWTEETVRGIANEHGIPPRPKGGNPPTYKPSPEIAAAFAALTKAGKDYEEKRQATRKAVADDLRAAKVSHARVAEHTPWTEATVRSIAEEHGVPPLRKPTVRSIHD
ncbi:hypothetical protein GCM10010387_15970 [Streptomyces inusitatus]|uniref:Uncharacterized protein n=1 Tax=Streptomyces inusitatus TaxID=68221 RepID=A0A918UN29_9ACTN|nr:hypothetical protein [Streptomyces inusitatus]GGZ23582.1 hypothetical protein GCM10010387_15970 [Streptomyces inusitatus]